MHASNFLNIVIIYAAFQMSSEHFKQLLKEFKGVPITLAR
jgi:hypothetical protein